MDKTYDYKKSASHFLIPFRFDTKKFSFCDFEAYIGDRWKKSEEKFDYKARYLLSHVNAEFAKIHVYQLSDGEAILQNVLHLQSGFVDDKEEYDFQVKRITLRVYPTGMGFVEILIQYPDDDTEYIANVSANLSRFFRNDRDKEGEKDGCPVVYPAKVCLRLEGEPFVLSSFLYSALGNVEQKRAPEQSKAEQRSSVVFFPNTENARTYVFHRIISQKTDSNYALQENLWASSKNDGRSAEQIPLGDNHYCLISQKCMCHIYEGELDIEDTKAVEAEAFRQQNIDASYYFMFLLCLHEQQTLFSYYARVNDFMDENKEEGQNRFSLKNAQDIKSGLLQCKVDYAFPIVSEEKNYQTIYNAYRQILELDSLEGTLTELISTIGDELDARKDRFVNTILGIITVLSLVSVIGDTIGLVGVFTESLTIKLVIMIIEIVIAVILTITMIINLLRK